MAKALHSGSRTEPEPGAAAGSMIEQARRLAPMFRANGEANERLRMLTPETAAALSDSRLFGIWTPESLGGGARDRHRCGLSAGGSGPGALRRRAPAGYRRPRHPQRQGGRGGGRLSVERGVELRKW